MLVQRPEKEVFYQVPDTLSIDSSNIAEISPKDSPKRFTMSYRFRTPGSAQSPPPIILTGFAEEDVRAKQAAIGAGIDRLMPSLASQLEDFVFERTYEIGLGDYNSEVGW